MAEAPEIRVVDSSRIQVLNRRGVAAGRYVLYWMQQSQRAQANHALEYAIEMANHLDLPVRTVFGLTGAYPEANLRHFTFMLEGLRETAQRLRRRGVQFAVQLGEPPEVALEHSRRAAAVVCDRGYLRHQKRWRRQVAREAACRVVQVESDVIVPVETVSGKREYAARTIRPKIHKLLQRYLQPLDPIAVRHPVGQSQGPGLDLDDLESVLGRLNLDTAVQPVPLFFQGGARQAEVRLEAFLDQRLQTYDSHSNQPQTDDVSGLSPYLHFGQISPLTLALQVLQTDRRRTGTRNVEAFLEQLTVRRELAMNFVHYTADYDAYSSIPAWARKTLDEHAADPREYLYTPGQLEAAQTHDPYWNAAMEEMKQTGFMHNYMRMYWGKKILEWSPTPQEAFHTTLQLNNRYFLDGRDANSYTGVAWIYGLHDRAWAERPVLGKIRYMAAAGLERKCDIQAYVDKVKRQARQNSGSK